MWWYRVGCLWGVSWWVALVIGLWGCPTPARALDESNTSADYLRMLDEDLTQIESGLNMTDLPLSGIEQSLASREKRLQTRGQTLDGREQELNMRETDLNVRELTYGALLVEVGTLKDDLEAAHAHGMRLLLWGATGGFLVGALVVGLVMGM